jgi:hypothetical protein
MKSKLILTYVLILSAICVSANNDKYRLILVDDPATTITIGWNQISGTSPTLYYDTIDHGTNHSLYSFSKTEDRAISFKGMDNRYVRLTGLTPNTNYYFVINDSQGTSQRFWFRTAPNDNSRLSFIAGGDSRNNRTPRQNANLLVSKLKPHAVLFGGDMTDNSTNGEWQNWFDDWQLTTASDGRMFPIIPARGNHEDGSDVYNLFDTPNANSYYALTFGNNLIRTYTLNSEISVLGSQKTWLEGDLNTAPAALKWKMAQYHKPMRPHTAWKNENNAIYDAWANLFYNEGVRLVVDCDSHMAKTTWPVKPSSEPENDEGFVVEQVNGTVYTGEGCWGAPLRSNDDDKTWTRSSGSFNQFKLIFVEDSKIELRTINVNNAASVGSVSNTDPFTLPALLDVFSPPTGDVVTISNMPDTNCPLIGTKCDDNDPTTVNDEEDGNCNCIGFAPETLTVDTHIINNTSDDAEELISTGVVDINSTDLELVTDASDQVIGVRFRDINIPKGATILRSYIQFRTDEVDSGQTDLVIHGELANASATFNTTPSNISSRQLTLASENWDDIGEWDSLGEAGLNQRSPYLNSIISEIITQPGWQVGNAITFLISGTGKRVADSRNGSVNGAPTLVVFYNSNCPILSVTPSTQSACDDVSDTYSQDLIIEYVDPPTTGTLDVNGQSFTIGTSPQTVTLTGLTADGLDVDVSASFSAESCDYSATALFEAPSKCSLGGIPDNVPDDNSNLGLLSEAILSGSAVNGRGTPEVILYDPVIDDYHTVTSYNEYGVAFSQNLGTVGIEDGFKWQVNWPNVKYINYITFGGSYANQDQSNSMWIISHRKDGVWTTLAQGQGGWIDDGIFEWGGPNFDPIEADALRVQVYSDGTNNLVSIHLRARGGIANNNNDSSTTPKATLIQYLSPGNSCGINIPANSMLYCDGSWIYSDGPDESSGTTNTIIADDIYVINADEKVEINDLEIYSGATVIIKEGASLTVKGDLINNGDLILESISTKYSSLIVEGSSTGNVSYKRHVNAFNGSTGNDLVSSPFSGETFGDFSTANPNIFENPTNTSQKLFGPFNEVSGSYSTYDSSLNINTLIEKGVGYRAARDASEDITYGTTLTFNGNVETGSVSLPISESTSAFSGWNLVGNPYPSYIDFDTFFNLNKTQLDVAAYQAIYGYDGNASNGWTILNNVTTNQLIAPGQGFFVKSKTGGGTVTFTPAMRTNGTSDDFILGRTQTSHFGHLNLELRTNESSFDTDFYFNSNASAGLDPGYDAALYAGNLPDLAIFSYLVQNNDGTAFAIQTLSQNDMENVIIPLGVNANQGQEITISIFETDIPDSISIYLEDTLNNTLTLLNSDDYVFTTNSDLSGGGRFYLRFQAVGLSTPESLKENISIRFNNRDKTVEITGQIENTTHLKLYDINGRTIISDSLDISSTIQTIDVSNLTGGIYIVELISNINDKRIEKLIIK